MMARVSIIIVTYNSEKEIKDCLDSILAQAAPACEIIVVDNGSKDHTIGILDEYRGHIKPILQDENHGYARGNNTGSEVARGKYLFLLNPDTVVSPGAIKTMVDFMEQHREVMIVAPLMLNPDGSAQPSVRRFPTPRTALFELLGLSRLFPRSNKFNSWRIPDFDYSKTQEIEQPMAAALLLRSEFLGGQLFDERFVMFFNDVDLCKRVWDNNGKIVFCPDAAVVHSRGASTAKVKERMVPLHTRGFIQYLQKYYRSAGEKFLLWLYAPAMVLNAAARIFLFRILGIDL